MLDCFKEHMNNKLYLNTRPGNQRMQYLFHNLYYVLTLCIWNYLEAYLL